MSILSNYAVYQNEKFVTFQKNIEIGKKTVVRVISCGFCGTDKHTFGELNVSGSSLGHETLAEIIHIGNNHHVVGGETISVGDRVILIPGKNCNKCNRCTTHTGQGNLCEHRTAHGHEFFSSNRFFAAGGFSSYIELMDDAWLIRVPESLSDNIAVLAEPLAICVRAVDRAISGIRPDRDLGVVVAGRAAVIGLGSIGYLVSYVLKSFGFDVVGFEASQYRCDFFEENLELKSVNIPISDSDQIDKYISTNSFTQDFDVVFECAGTIEAFIASLIAVRKGGRIIEMGNYIQHDSAGIDPSWICRKEIELIGFSLANPYTYKKVFNLLQRNSLEPLNSMTNQIKLSKINSILKFDHEKMMKVVVVNDL